MRLFVAIELEEGFRKKLVAMQEALRGVVPRVSFTRPENLHLTLKFIGEVEEQRLPELCDALSAVPKVGKFQLTLAGLDLLPERGPIRIIAAAVDGGEKLLEVQKAVEEACATQNISRENRRYRPHITLARARQPIPRSRKSDLMHTPPSEAASSNVADFVLMQSTLSNKGSEYMRLYRVRV